VQKKNASTEISTGYGGVYKKRHGIRRIRLVREVLFPRGTPDKTGGKGKGMIISVAGKGGTPDLTLPSRMVFPD